MKTHLGWPTVFVSVCVKISKSAVLVSLVLLPKQTHLLFDHSLSDLIRII